ncbi:MAG: type II secretion system minor pseudopilin GspH [Ferrimonas sp.]
MAHLSATPARQRGFTLIELLLVVTLIGVMAGAVSLVFGGDKTAAAMREQGNELSVVVATALEEAQLRGELYGVVIEPHRYFFARWEPQGERWERLASDERLFRERQVDEALVFSLQVEGLPLTQDEEQTASQFGLDKSLFERSEEQKNQHPEPQILLLPSGEMTAFRLFLQAKQGTTSPTLELVMDAFGRPYWAHEVDN